MIRFICSPILALLPPASTVLCHLREGSPESGHTDLCTLPLDTKEGGREGDGREEEMKGEKEGGLL